MACHCPRPPRQKWCNLLACPITAQTIYPTEPPENNRSQKRAAKNFTALSQEHTCTHHPRKKILTYFWTYEKGAIFFLLQGLKSFCLSQICSLIISVFPNTGIMIPTSLFLLIKKKKKPKITPHTRSSVPAFSDGHHKLVKYLLSKWCGCCMLHYLETW